MESSSHLELCKMLKKDMDAAAKHQCQLFWETGTTAFREFPHTAKISGFLPDLRVYSGDSLFCLIGDAKTNKDIDNKHTKSQLIAFLNNGNKYKSFALFLRVPQNCYHFCAHLINGLGLPNLVKKKIYINNVLFEVNI